MGDPKGTAWFTCVEDVLPINVKSKKEEDMKQTLNMWRKTLLSTLAALGFFARQSWLPSDFPDIIHHPLETNSRMGPNAECPWKSFTRKPGVLEKGGSYQTTRVSSLVELPLPAPPAVSPHTFRSQGAQHVARTHLVGPRWAKRCTKETIISKVSKVSAEKHLRSICLYTVPSWN